MAAVGTHMLLSDVKFQTDPKQLTVSNAKLYFGEPTWNFSRVVFIDATSDLNPKTNLADGKKNTSQKAHYLLFHLYNSSPDTYSSIHIEANYYGAQKKLAIKSEDWCLDRLSSHRNLRFVVLLEDLSGIHSLTLYLQPITISPFQLWKPRIQIILVLLLMSFFALYIYQSKSQKQNVLPPTANFEPMGGAHSRIFREQNKKFVSMLDSVIGKDSAKQFYANSGFEELENGNMKRAVENFNKSWLLDSNYYRPYWGFAKVLDEQNADQKMIHPFLVKAFAYHPNQCDLLLDVLNSFNRMQNDGFAIDKMNLRFVLQKKDELHCTQDSLVTEKQQLH